MRIFMFVHSLRRGGAERIALELALGLQNLGHDVAIVSWIDVDEYIENRYAKISRYYILKSNDYRWIKSIPRSIFLLRKMINQYTPHVIQIHSFNMVWVAALAITTIPCIHVLHGYSEIKREDNLLDLFIRHMHRMYARRRELIFVTVSNSMQSVASKFFAVDMERIVAIPNGINLKSFPFIGRRFKKRYNIVMIGTLNSNKGQKLALKTFKNLLYRFPYAKFRIVGDGDDRSAIEDLIAELDIKSSVFLSGRSDDIATILAESDVLWHLSQSEGMPMVVLEAMATGVPVVGFDVCGTQDAIVHNKTGFLVSYGDVEDVIAKTTLLLINDKEYEKMAFNGRVRVEMQFASELFVHRHEKLLLSVKK